MHYKFLSMTPCAYFRLACGQKGILFPFLLFTSAGFFVLCHYFSVSQLKITLFIIIYIKLRQSKQHELLRLPIDKRKKRYILNRTFCTHIAPYLAKGYLSFIMWITCYVIDKYCTESHQLIAVLSIVQFFKWFPKTSTKFWFVGFQLRRFLQTTPASVTSSGYPINYI